MKLNFRQGLVSYQQVGSSANFLSQSSISGFIDLNVDPTPFIATVSHGTSEYLLKFDTAIQGAWGPIPAGLDTHLYLSVNTVTGVVSRGVTILEPIVSTEEPMSAVPGQMWFDLNKNVMRVRANDVAKWLDEPRLVVGKVQSGTTIVHRTVGSTVGLNVEVDAGYLMLDSQLRPLRTSTGELLTTNSPIRVNSTVGTSGVLTNPVNNFIPVRAAEPIPAMSLVYLVAADTVGLASSNPALVIPRSPIGLVESDLAQNETGVITQTGEVTFDQWNWSAADIGKPVYCGQNGEVTAVRPPSVQVYRVGYIKNSKTILFLIDSETQVQVVSAPGAIISGLAPVTAVTSVNGIGEIVTSISMEPATPTTDGFMSAADSALLQGFETRISTNETDIGDLQTTKSDVGHVHTFADVTDLQTTIQDISDDLLTKMPIDDAAVQGNIAVFTSTGEVQDSGSAPSAFALSSHTHAIADTTSLQTELDGKAPTVHSHAIADSTGLQTELDGKALLNHSHSIAGVTGLQTSLDGKAALSHTHTIVQVSGLQTSLDNKASITHTHTIANVTGLQAELDDKAPLSHGHAIADTTGLQTALDGKASTSHGHAIADTSGLQAELDGKAPSAHGHTIAGITGLQSTLDGKSDTTHRHALGTIDDVDFSTTPVTNDVLTFNGTSWVSAAPAASIGGNSLTSSTVLFGAASSMDFTFKMETLVANMSYGAQYLADFNNGIGWTGVYDTSLSRTGTGVTFLPNSKVSTHTVSDTTSIGSVSYSGLQDALFAEIEIGSSVTSSMFVGIFIQAYGPPFSPNSSGGPLSVKYFNTGTVQSYGSTGSGTAWGAGDIIGIVGDLTGSLVTFYLNGVQQSTVAASDNQNWFLVTGTSS